MTLLTKLRQSEEIETFHMTIFQLKVGHKCMGGRYFSIPNQAGKVKMNDITKKMYELFKTVSKERDPTQSYSILQECLHKMKELEGASSTALKKRFIWIRFCTRLCRVFGNFWYDRNRSLSRVTIFLQELEQKKIKQAENPKHPLVKLIEEAQIPVQVQEYCDNLIKGEKKSLKVIEDVAWDRICKEIVQKLLSQLRNDQFVETRKVFRGIKGDPLRFLILVMNFLQLPGFSINHLMTCLQKVEWPSQDLMKKVLPILAYQLVENPNEVHPTTVTSEKKELQVLHLDFGLERIFGKKNFSVHPEAISKYLVEGMLLYFCKMGEIVLKAISEDANHIAGLKITLEQTDEIKIPAEMLVPILPILAEVPGLVALDMAKLSAGFKDVHINLLINILKKHPKMAPEDFKVFTCNPEAFEKDLKDIKN